MNNWAWQQAWRFDQAHKGPGPGGGQFTFSGQGGSGTSVKTGGVKGGKGGIHTSGLSQSQQARKSSLLRQAAADRARAKALEQELRGLEAQLRAANATTKKAAAGAKKTTTKAKTAKSKTTTTTKSKSSGLYASRK